MKSRQQATLRLRSGRASNPSTSLRADKQQGKGGRGDLAFPVACRMPRAAAFSLIELVISLAILSVGLVGAMRVFPMGLRASARSEMQSRAVMAAQRKIESLKLSPWDDLVPSEETVQDDGFDVITRIREPGLVGFIDPDRIKAIEVTVQSRIAGKLRELNFITYVHRTNS